MPVFARPSLEACVRGRKLPSVAFPAMGSTSILHRTLSSCTISSQLSGKSGHLARPCLLANCRSNRSRTPSWSRPDARRRYSAANDRPSDKTTDPVRELDTSLEVLPRFRTRGEDVTILQDPRQWKEWLMKSISDAKDRIFIASLYIGTERTDLIQALHDALSKRPNLRLTILLDFLRSTREYPSQSSASLIAALQASFPDRVDLFLYHTPDLDGWRKKLIPRRFDEGWGLWHGKVYGFDDVVCLSGANLAESYFTNRQDRYHVFRSKSLSSYYNSLLQTASSFSYTIKSTSTSSKDPSIKIEWPQSRRSEPPFSLSDVEMERRGVKVLKSPEMGRRVDFRQNAREVVDEFVRREKVRSDREEKDLADGGGGGGAVEKDTILRPFTQFGPLGIKEETDLVVPAILKYGRELSRVSGGQGDGGGRATLDWTSGYFSLWKGYKREVLREGGGEGRMRIRIVCAAPEANGFFGSKGVSKYIPPAYTFYEKLFWEAVVKKGLQDDIELREWNKEGWTYHAKGMWLTPPWSTTPDMTLLGSSNFGPRSSSLDLETSLIVSTTSARLRESMKEEVDGLREHAGQVVDDGLFEREDRKVH